MSRLPPTAFGAVVAGALAFTGVGLAEVLWLGDALAGPGAWTTRAIVVGFAVLAGLAIGLAFAVWAPSFARIAAPRRFLRRCLWPGEAEPTELNRAAAWLIAAFVGAGAAAGTASVGGALAHGFSRTGLAAAFVALAALGGIAAGAAVAFPVRAFAAWALERMAPDGRLLRIPTPALPLAAAALAVAAAALWLGRLDLGAFRLEWLALLALGTGLTALALAVFGGRPPFRLGLAGGLALMGPLGLAAFSLVGFDSSPQPAARLPLKGQLSRVILSGLRRLADGDGDGASQAFGGGDCDDDNPAVGPFAREIPGNGIDDDCQGGDAPIEVEEEPPPPPPPVAPGEPRDAPKRLNVVILLVDTLRPDHLGVYGYGRPTSPRIDAFAAGATVFERVYAQAPNTPRSVPSLFMGRYPSRIDWVKRFDRFSGVVPDANESLFEIFSKGGWTTEAVSAHWYFERATNIKDGVDLWDNRGFLSIKESNTQSAAPELTARVVARLEALGRAEQPFVLFAHYFEPHSRYMNQPSVRVFGKSLLDKYDSEIAFVDHHLGPVFEALARPALAENTIVLFTSDHGEAFKEHGFHFHGRTVYDEELRVPLIVRFPGAEPKRVDALAGLIDVLPTLAEAVGLSAPRAQGQSLLPLITGLGQFNQDRVLFLEQLPYPHYEVHVMGAVQGPLKLIRNLTENVWELFDLARDPAEKTNLLESDPNAGEALRRALQRHIDRDPGR